MIDRIYCKNFRRIEEADIVLRNGITVIVGNNGTGKSSIIESVLFTFFGKAKAGTKKETVRRKTAAEGDPTVTFVDFTLDGVHYRCMRWYTKKMSLMASLRSYSDEEYAKLQAQDEPAHLDKSLGEEVATGTSGVTNAIVNDVLRISYEGFKASFIAQQKELDSLASLTLENRKKFFLDLLGYDKLDDVKPEISKSLRALQSTVSVIEKQNLSAAEIERDMGKHEKEIVDKKARIEKGHGFVEKAKKSFDEAAASYEDCRAVAEKVNAYSADVSKLETEKATLESETAQLSQSIEENKKKSEGYDANSSVGERLADARDRALKAREVLHAKEERAILEGGKAARDASRKANLDKIAELVKRTEKEPDIDTPQKALSVLREQLAAKTQEGKAAKASRQKMSDLLDDAKAGKAAKCPTCGSEVSSDEGQAHLENEITSLDALMDGLRGEVKALNKDIADADEALSIAKLNATTYQRDLNEKVRLEQENATLDADEKAVQKQIDGYREKEERLSEYSLDRNALRKLDEQIATLSQQLTRENEMKTAYYKVQEDSKALSLKQSRLDAIGGELAEKSEYVRKNSKTVARASKLLAAKNEASEKLDSYRELVSQYEKDLSQAEALLSAARGNLKLAKEQSKQLSELKENIEAHVGAQQVVEFLRRSLPARIAPRLAFEASQLLDIATNGRYTMLDIDENYEVFVYTDDDVRPMSQMSGGEADVISLCIRISIAKLLLEATGVQEQTFILDEIFGALDDERRESTCSALQNIGEQLSKILCITHIDEIKDMADYTYVVEMDENSVSHVREVIDKNIGLADAVFPVIPDVAEDGQTPA